MRALVLSAPGEWRIAEMPEAVAASDEVVVEVAGAGICGSDLHALAGHNPLVRYPVIPGHEFAGTVVAVGESVGHLRVGDRVAVDPSRQCGHCQWCHAGRPNLCPDKGGYGSRYPGGFAERVAVRANACVVLPAHLPTVLGALTEPLACVVHGVDRLGPVLGDTVLVYGAGPVGLLLLALLRRAGAAAVDVVELSPARRDAAGALGASSVVEDPATFVDDRRWPVVVDATGNARAIADGLARIERGGRLLIMGVAAPDAEISVNPFDMYRRELTLLGSMAFSGTYERALDLLGAGLVDESIISHRFGLEDAAEAIATVRAGTGRKIIITPNATPATAAMGAQTPPAEG